MKYICDCGNEMVQMYTAMGIRMACPVCGNVEVCPKEKENEYDKKATGKITN